MAKNWDYAELSKWISEHGGPQAAVKLLKETGYRDGTGDAWTVAKPVIACAGFVGLLIGIVAVKYGPGAVASLKRQIEVHAKPKATDDELAEAERQIIDAVEQSSSDTVRQSDDDSENTGPAAVEGDQTQRSPRVS